MHAVREDGHLPRGVVSGMYALVAFDALPLLSIAVLPHLLIVDCPCASSLAKSGLL